MTTALPPTAVLDAETFLHGAALSLGASQGGRRALCARIATLLHQALPEAMVRVTDLDEGSGEPRSEAQAGQPGETTDPAHHYELDLAHDGNHLGTAHLTLARPLTAPERAQLEALAQHAGIALLRARLEAVDETALLVGLDGRVQACSRQTVERLELPPGDDPAIRWPLVKERLGQGRAVRYTEQAAGRIRDCSLHPVQGDDGQLRAFAAFARDITEQVRLQERVRQAAIFQRALFSSLSESILVLDEGGRITDCNRAARLTLGMDEATLVGRSVAEICAQREAWEHWERELLPRLEPGGEPVQLELRLRRADGAGFTARVGASRIALPDAAQSVVWTLRDVTDELLRFEQLQHLATHDALTGLPNRLLFQDRLGRAREAGRRYATSFAVLMLDLDGFKPVNDTLGHEMGDRLLAALGARLRGSLRAADTVSRLGGDEFAVLLPNSITTSQAAQVAQKLLKAIERPFTLDGRALHVSASIGVAMFPEHDEADLLDRADQAMYAAKRAGGRRVVLAGDAGEG